MSRRDRDAPPEDFAGTARFQVVRRLGGGGMGVVYEALDQERGARVALKTMRLQEPRLLLRFKNEFRALAELDHPNVAQLGELHEDKGRWFFTMELVEGCDFLSWVRPRVEVRPAATGATTLRDAAPEGPHTADLRAPAPPRGRVAQDPTPRYDETRLRAAFSQLAEGLAALHRAGQVHRDIKPQNVIVTPTGRVVIVDFGLVKGIDGQRTVSSVAGTIAYMAPEQAAALPVGAPADWWSAGVVLYEALTGRLPYADPTTELLAASAPLPPAPPRQLVPDVPPDLDELAMELLSHSPELRPQAREILRRLRVDALVPARLELERLPFVGREAELDALERLYERAAGKTTGAVIVEGESGIGKSALAQKLTDTLLAREPRPMVLFGRCHERESVPFKAIDGVVDALSRQLARLDAQEAAAVLPRQVSLLAQVFPVLFRAPAVAKAPPARPLVPDPHERRLRAFAALKDLLARLADRRPLVVVIDDLHWADADSLALLAELLRAPDAPALLLVATLRSGEGLPPARELAARLPCPVEHLRLGSLPRDAALKLVDALAVTAGRRLAPDERAAIADESGGHPLFVGELVRRTHADPAAPRLEDALWAQIARLDEAPRRLLEIVAVAGAPLAQAVAARAADCALAELAPITNSLRAAHFVSTGGTRASDVIEAFHDRIVAAVIAHLDEATLRARHERLAHALEDSGRSDPETLGRHWLGAGQRAKAAAFYRQAALEAFEALAFERAVRLYQRAFELAPPVGADWTRLGDALHNIGRGVEAARAYLEAARAAPVDEALDLRRRAAEHLLRGGHVDEGLALLGEVLAAVGLALPSSPRAALWRLIFRRAQLRLRGLGHRVREARELTPETLQRIDVCGTAAVGTPVANLLYGAYFQARHVQYALAAGEPARLCKALATDAVNAAAEGERGRARAERLLGIADELAQKAASPTARAQATMGAGISAFLLGDWRRGADVSERAVALYRDCEGVGWELGNAQVFALLSLVYLGEYAALARRLPEAAREAEERGDLHALITLRTGQPALAWLAAGDPDRARREIEAARAARPGSPWLTQRAYYDLFAETHIDLYTGDARAAHERMCAGWPALEKSFLLGLTQIRLLMLDLRARAALAAAEGPRDPLLGAVEKRARALERERAGWSAALAALLRAGLAQKRGQPERAAPLIDAAIRGFTQSEMKLHAACARLRRGGDDEAEARAWMGREQIADPARIAAMLAPGWPPG